MGVQSLRPKRGKKTIFHGKRDRKKAAKTAVLQQLRAKPFYCCTFQTLEANNNSTVQPSKGDINYSSIFARNRRAFFSRFVTQHTKKENEHEKNESAEGEKNMRSD